MKTADESLRGDRAADTAPFWCDDFFNFGEQIRERAVSDKDGKVTPPLETQQEETEQTEQRNNPKCQREGRAGGDGGGKSRRVDND